MKARQLAFGACASVVVASGAIALGSACVTSVQNLLLNVPFDGGYLGPCSDGATRQIEAGQCPGACSGPGATAICVGSSYGECSCLPSTAMQCDSGCCADKRTGYVPVPCNGKVVIPDPSEGLCPTTNGYLICNGTCYASFACEIPKGYTLQGSGKDAGPDVDANPIEGGRTEAGGPEGGDGGSGTSDAGSDAGEAGTDAPSMDGAKG